MKLPEMAARSVMFDTACRYWRMKANIAFQDNRYCTRHQTHRNEEFTLFFGKVTYFISSDRDRVETVKMLKPRNLSKLLAISIKEQLSRRRLFHDPSYQAFAVLFTTINASVHNQRIGWSYSLFYLAIPFNSSRFSQFVFYLLLHSPRK